MTNTNFLISKRGTGSSSASTKKGHGSPILKLALLAIICVAFFANFNSLNRPTLSSTGKNKNKVIKKSYRRFVSYHPSPWEQDWLDNVDQWSQSLGETCRIITETDVSRVRDFLKLTCTNWFQDPYSHWCVQDDEVSPMYYNSNFGNDNKIEWTYKKPVFLKGIQLGPMQPVRPGPQHEHIVSKFVFLDEFTGEQYVEYIEPLVSGLRHPLARCHKGGPSNGGTAPITFRGYIIPVPVRPRGGENTFMLYFDAGASSWAEGDGGPSIQYFTNTWSRHGINFDRIQAYEMKTTPQKFYDTVPPAYQGKAIFRQCAVASSAETSDVHHPFLPFEMQHIAREQDFVLFKLDIDSPLVEDGSIKYLLEHDEVRVDELAWEHHVNGNPIMSKIWGMNRGVMANMTLGESYDFFLRMRRKGIRAHSWV